MADPSDGFPRPLLSHERDALVYLLEAQPSALREPLLAQVPHAMATAPCPCGCPSIDMEVDQDAVPPAKGAPSPLPIEGQIDMLGLIVFCRDGYLSGLELYSNDGEPMPDRFPAPGEISLIEWGEPDDAGVRRPHPHVP